MSQKQLPLMDISKLLISPYEDFANTLQPFELLVGEQERLRKQETLNHNFCLQLFHGLSFVKYKRDCKTIDVIIDPVIERLGSLMQSELVE